MRFKQILKSAQDKKDDHLLQALLKEKNNRFIRLAHQELDPVFYNQAALVDQLLALMNLKRMSMFLTFSDIAYLEVKQSNKKRI